MKRLTIQLEGEEALAYEKIMDNFNTQKFNELEINKRIFLRGMLEAANIMNQIVQQRDTPEPYVRIVGPAEAQLDYDPRRFMGA